MADKAAGDKSTNLPMSGGDENKMSSVQRQLAEYRRSMQTRVSQQLESDDAKQRLLINNSTNESQRASVMHSQRAGPTSKSQEQMPRAPGIQDDSTIDIQESTERFTETYRAPPLTAGTKTRQSKDSSMSESQLLFSQSSKGRNCSIVCINQLPVLNVFDLTKRSANMIKMREGVSMDDLEYQIQADSQINESDLVALEKEVNKKKRRKHKEAKTGGLMSPRVSSRCSTQPLVQQQQALQAENAIDAERNLLEQMRNDQLIQNPMGDDMNMEPRRELILCFGLFRRRENGHLDIACAKDLSQDFVYMLIFVSGITLCLSLYAAYA